jgi:hypothetical protein
MRRRNLGANSILIDAVTGKPALQIRMIAWKNDWPEAAPGTTDEAK